MTASMAQKLPASVEFQTDAGQRQTGLIEHRALQSLRPGMQPWRPQQGEEREHEREHTATLQHEW